ncbi:MAG TPA: hypothetical protein VGO52_27395, partial [Hyphomonadaceae bacterium]|nr:hypothetical protein [Hyphomonadaceae bacterium]
MRERRAPARHSARSADELTDIVKETRRYATRCRAGTRRSNTLAPLTRPTYGAALQETGMPEKAAPDISAMSFEDALAQLEQIVHKLE